MLREFKVHPEFGSIPVVVLTHEERDPLLDTCFQARAEDYLPKPIRQEVLLARLRGHAWQTAPSLTTPMTVPG